MSVRGLGTDIVSVARMQDLLQTHGERFLKRCFGPREIQAIRSRPAGEAQASAAALRWAAKEAFLKALGHDVRHIPYHDVEVVDGPDGPATFAVHGRAGEAAVWSPGFEALLSVSRDGDQALALVLIQDHS